MYSMVSFESPWNGIHLIVTTRPNNSVFRNPFLSFYTHLLLIWLFIFIFFMLMFYLCSLSRKNGIFSFFRFSAKPNSTHCKAIYFTRLQRKTKFLSTVVLYFAQTELSRGLFCPKICFVIYFSKILDKK